VKDNVNDNDAAGVARRAQRGELFDGRRNACAPTKNDTTRALEDHETDDIFPNQVPYIFIAVRISNRPSNSRCNGTSTPDFENSKLV